MVSFRLKIAEMLVLIETDIPLQGWEKTYQEFLSDSGDQRVSLRLHWGEVPKCNGELRAQSFKLGPWDLSRLRGRWVLTPPSDNPGQSAVAICEEDFSRGDIYYGPCHPSAQSLSQLLSHPIHQVIMVSVLAEKRGGMFHAAGVDDKGDGYLFLGKSREGKSTMASLWKEARVLDDDRIVVRERDGRFWMYGTPWHSIPKGTSPSGLPLKSLFLLKKGAENLAVRKRGIEAFSSMLQRCFLPFWLKDGTEYVLNLCARMAEKIPCYELSFSPDASIVDYVRNLPG